MPTQTPPQRHPTTKGFTLIELMIVVVIIGILAAIAIPKFNSVARTSKEAEAQSILKQIYTLELRYKERHDHFTTDIDSLEGGIAVGSDAKYYDFNVITSHLSGFCVAAAPSTPEGVDAGVSPQSIDADRVLYRTDDCS